jgi:hypothetical protein
MVPTEVSSLGKDIGKQEIYAPLVVEKLFPLYDG